MKYEVEPKRRAPGPDVGLRATDIETCAPREAEFWAVYVRRGEVRGWGPAVHVADFEEKCGARALVRDLKAFDRACGEDEEPYTFLVDALVAMLHWAEIHGVSLTEALETARAHYAFESEGLQLDAKYGGTK